MIGKTNKNSVLSIACLWSILAILLCYPKFALSVSYQLPPQGSNIIGDISSISLEPGDSLQLLSREHGMGYDEMALANPQINPKKPKQWGQLIIPSAYILPDAPRDGIVINLPEKRLYYFPKDRSVVMTFPIGVGRAGWTTPTLKTKIVEMSVDPIWFVPKSIRAFMAKKGKYLPDRIMPGPNNPLGAYALHLKKAGYLIHGTNRPNTVGKRSSSGCIRLYPEDIEELFASIEIGTPVYIVNQPYKVGRFNGEIYLEAHPPFEDLPPVTIGNKTPLQTSLNNAGVNVDFRTVKKIASEHLGYPRFIK